MRILPQFFALLSVFLFSSVALGQTGLGVGEDDVVEWGADRQPGEEPVIPMNPEDPTWDAWKLKRDDLQEGRVPGAFNPQRYRFGMDWQGIPTFFKQPIALTPADLEASDVDVAMIGAYTDMGSGGRGAHEGPMAMRACCIYGGWGDVDMPHIGTGVDPFQVLNVVDYGDAPVDIMSTERSVHAIREIVREAAMVKNKKGKHVIPVIIGGDHSLMYPDVAALADVYGKGNVGVIHFDSHYDAGKYFFGHLIGHGMPVYRLIKEGHVPGKNFIQVALRGYYPDRETFEWLQEQGLRYHTMNEIVKRGWPAVMEDVIREANEGPEYLFISFDIDALDPAYMPGTGTPEPGGMTTREAFRIVRRLCAETNVVGFELVELAPALDPGYTTVLNSNRLVRECLVGMALRAEGKTSEDYFDPIYIQHGQD